MDCNKGNKTELLKTIKKYGDMPINPERTTFLANCWAAYQALCMIGADEEPSITAFETASHNDHNENLLTTEQIMCWVASMVNADGKRGGRWPMEQTEQVRIQKNIDCDPVMFFAAMNMMYSDYCKVAEKFNVGTTDFYAYMAKAFLDDQDAVQNKLAWYYHSIVKT